MAIASLSHCVDTNNAKQPLYLIYTPVKIWLFIFFALCMICFIGLIISFSVWKKFMYDKVPEKLRDADFEKQDDNYLYTCLSFGLICGAGLLGIGLTAILSSSNS